MMVDGPAANFNPILGRVPIYLRVVIDRETDKQDVLDQLADTPRPSEDVHVYELVPGGALAHACTRGEGPSGWVAEYRHRPDVDGETLRETEAWQTWANAEGERLGRGVG